MAEEGIKVYNITILKRQSTNIFNHLAACAVAALAFICLLAPKAYGQAALQPSTGSLQPQSGEAQAPASNLNQTDEVQNNSGGQSFLNQGSLRPLGVVSDPKKTSPDAVVAPSPTLKTDITKKEAGTTSILPFIAIGSFAVVVIGVVYLWRAERKPQTVLNTRVEEVAALPEPVKRIKKDKKTRKKRNKPNQR